VNCTFVLIASQQFESLVAVVFDGDVAVGSCVLEH